MTSTKKGEPKVVLNFGAGVDSTAMCFEMHKRGEKPDIVIFADTGCEMPPTYEHLERMKEWFKKVGWEFVIVRSKYGNLYDYYFNKKMIPSRQFRDCTDKFKKMPITNYIKQWKKEKVIQLIGIDAGEIRRCRASGSEWITFRYPLVEWNINREGCLDIIRDEFIPIPCKSGCFVCPFQSMASWQKLADEHPDLFAKASLMESNGRRYPKLTLGWNNKTLDKILVAKREQKRLFTPQMQCDGWCML